MPMTIKSREEYDEVYSAVLFGGEIPPEEVTYVFLERACVPLVS